LAEIQSLIDGENITRQWTSQNGIEGEKFTDRTNGKSIFLPAAGYRGGDGYYVNEGTVIAVGSEGDYYSSSYYGYGSAYYLFFRNNGYKGVGWGNYMSCGQSIRPVAN